MESRLLIFTSISPSFVAIWEGKTVYEMSVLKGRGSRFLSRIIDAFRMPYDEIWVGIGPGLFTGTRVGVAYALGLAAGLELDVIHVFDTFHFLYAPFYGEDAVIVLPARRGEVYVSLFKGGKQLSEGVYPVKDVNVHGGMRVISYADAIEGEYVKPSLEHFNAMKKYGLYRAVAPEDVKVKYLKSLTEEYKVYGHD